MSPRNVRAAIALLSVLTLSACGGATVRQGTLYTGALPRPEVILVHPFAASPEEMKVQMGVMAHLRGDVSDSSRTAKEIEAGQKLAGEIANELVKRIDAMGLPARRASGRPTAGSVAITGALVSVDEGNKEERAVIGLGKGKTELHLLVHLTEVMPEGRRSIDAFEVDATGGWKPGAAEMGVIGIAAGANPAVMILTNVGSSVASEKFSAGIDATAKHAADRTAEVLARFFAQHGWTR